MLRGKETKCYLCLHLGDNLGLILLWYKNDVSNLPVIYGVGAFF